MLEHYLTPYIKINSDWTRDSNVEAVKLLELTGLGNGFLDKRQPTHGHHQKVNTEIRLIIFIAAEDGEALYSQHKQDQELTVAQIMNTLLPNSDLN